jgi:ABC-type branched-subunit amino acid transport system ATPase component
MPISGTRGRSMLEIDSLVTGYGNLPVIHGLSMTVEEGSSVAIFGGNGVGKSTLLKTIAAWLPVQSGSITWDGQSLSGRDAVFVARAGVGFVPQENKVFASLSVAENLDLAADFKPGGAARLREIYDRFPILNERQRQKAGSLSGGERQLLAAVSALLMEPKLLLLDEPTTGLSPVATQRLTGLIAEVVRDGITLVWVVEQDPDVALEIVDRAHVMAGGELIASFDKKELKSVDLAKLLLGGQEEVVQEVVQNADRETVRERSRDGESEDRGGSRSGDVGRGRLR